jgi:hypothetical protein
MRAAVAVALLAGACAKTDARPTWALVAENVPGSVLSCFAAGPDDVTFVGSGGLIRRWDGTAFSSRASGTTEWLWWAWGCASGDVWAVGEHGTALRLRAGAVEPVASGTDAALYGVWGASCDDVWVVGGDPLGPTTDVVLRDTGGGLLPAGPPPRNLALFKVWGSAADDVIVVGDAGVAWRFDGKAWALEETGCQTRLFTVYGGAADDVIAVGGTCAVAYDGSAWGPVAGLDLTGRLPNGVTVAPDETAAIVGFGALKARREADGTWIDESDLDPIGVDFHAVCGDGRGGFFAVGGNFVSPTATQRGVIAHWGVDHPPLGP